MNLHPIVVAAHELQDALEAFGRRRPLADLKEDATIVPRLEALMRKRDVID